MNLTGQANISTAFGVGGTAERRKLVFHNSIICARDRLRPLKSRNTCHTIVIQTLTLNQSVGNHVVLTAVDETMQCTFMWFCLFCDTVWL